jgi:hypothetical protein
LKNHIKAHKVEYRVRWNKERARFDVFRGDVRTALFSHQRGTAVGIAIREAQQEAIASGDKIIVTSTLNGKLVMEWCGD